MRQGMSSVWHTGRLSFMSARIFIVPCYRWGSWLRGHRPRSHCKEDPSSSFHSSREGTWLLRKALCFRGVLSSALHSLEPQVRVYLLGLSPPIHEIGESPLPKLFGSSVRKHRAHALPKGFLSSLFLSPGMEVVPALGRAV